MDEDNLVNKEYQSEQLEFVLRFCVLVAGFVSRTKNHKELFENMLNDKKTAITIPTFHVFGDTDR